MQNDLKIWLDLAKRMQSLNKMRSMNLREFILGLSLVLAVAGWAAGQQAAGGQSASSQSASNPPDVAGKDQKPNSKVPDWQTPGLPSGVDPKTMGPMYTTIQEDWSSLDVGVSKLTPQPPLVAESDDTHETFIRQLVQLQWRPGDPIDVYVVLPKGLKRPPAVLYLYNFTEDTDRFRNDQWCETVTHGGVAAVGFVSALSGHRFHDRPMRQWFVSELQEALGSTVHDVKFILDYLASRGDIDMDHVGMFGTGSGGTIAILAAAADPLRIKAVDALDPWGDWPDWLAKSDVIPSDDPNRADYVKPEFLNRVAPLDPVKWLPELKTTKIRIQQVADWGNPMVVEDRIQEAAPKQAEVNRFAAATVLGKREGHGVLFDWVKSQLQPAKDSGTVKASASSLPSQAGGASAQPK